MSCIMNKLLKVSLGSVLGSVLGSLLLVASSSAFALTTDMASKSGHAAAVASKISADARIAIVDYMTIFQVVPQGKTKVMELKASIQPKIVALQKQQADLQKQVSELQKQAPTLTKEQKQTKERSLLEQQAKFQASVQQLQKEEITKEQAAADTFQVDVKNAVAKIGKERGYMVVLNSQAAPYFNAKYDISNDVIAVLKKSK